MTSQVAALRTDKQPEGTPFWETMAAWDAYASSDLRKRTKDEYGYWLLKFFWARLQGPEGVTTEDITSFLASLGEQGPSRQMARQACRHFFGWLAGTGRRRDNPAAYLPRTRGRMRPAPAYLEEDELTRLMFAAACHNQRWAWELMFIFGTGARVSEACSLKTEDVDLKARKVTFRRTKNGRDRIIPLGGSAFAAASALLDGKPRLLSVGPGAIWSRMQVVGRMAGLPKKKLHPHVLRHTAGTLLSERGADPRAIMEHLGHTDPSMTAWYTHITSKRAKETAELI